MQVDACHIHDTEDAAEHQRDAAGNYHARTHAQRQEAYREHDDDGFDQCLDEVMDGAIDDLRLIGNLMDLQTHWHFLLDLADLLPQLLAELQDIATLLHRHSYADGRFAIEIHLWFRRIDGLALHAGDIAEAKHLAIGIDRHLPDGIDIIENTADTQEDIVGTRLHLTSRRHIILRLERIGDNLRIDAQLSDLIALQLDIHDVGLFTDELDLLHARDVKEVTARLLRILAQLLIAVAIAGHSIDRAIDIIEAVIVIRTIDALRQIFLDCLAKIMDVAPDGADLILGHLRLQGYIDDRLARPRLTVDMVKARHILELLLKLIRYLFLHLLGRRARPSRRDDHLPDGELRVLHAAQLKIRCHAADGRHDDEVPDQRPMLQRYFCQIRHQSAASVRTLCPARSLCTPAVTTRSVGASPCTRT